MDPKFDPEHAVLAITEGDVSLPLIDERPMLTHVMQLLAKYPFFRSMVVEAELMGKIKAPAGNFYSKFSGCGVSWLQPARNYQHRYVCYYRVGKPPNTCGIWSRPRNCPKAVKLDIW